MNKSNTKPWFPEGHLILKGTGKGLDSTHSKLLLYIAMSRLGAAKRQPGQVGAQSVFKMQGNFTPPWKCSKSPSEANHCESSGYMLKLPTSKIRCFDIWSKWTPTVQSTTHTTSKSDKCHSPDLSADSGRSWFFLHLQGVICCIEDSLHNPIRCHHVGEDAHVENLQNGHPQTRNALLKGTLGGSMVLSCWGVQTWRECTPQNMAIYDNIWQFWRDIYHRNRPLSLSIVVTLAMRLRSLWVISGSKQY